ncbi:hypothetical protein LY90DRAFT_698497 [Neocallimastix californiae]|uniref:CBM1 domain-containing protein n=1 Tax=Neocallimastix californiae TaxID=1754190 RepID=A0A1Y2F398_9FUNG|nr:hypothetical protein LY90DRAFT_698497 [Neocallimastix californiae]|eukprot:ORY77435.1 hypothetical protein LY90DRAFT_698497 [Neocallimastix californiae]
MPTSQLNNLIRMAQISSYDVQSKGANNIPDFKYEEASIVAKWNGNSKTYDKVTFKTGGMYGRSYDKVGFNLKFDKKFLNRKSFKLRPDSGDASKIRSKLCCDIANRIGLPSIQGTYARLYMNNEFWGLYVFMDSIKTSWIKQTFNPSEKEVTTLFQCKTGGFNFRSNSVYACINANDDYQHMSEFSSFVNAANNARNISDLEKIMDVDIFLKYLAFEWLIGSSDHFMIYGHNFNWYKRESDGKWVVIYYDYDNTFGNGASYSLWANKGLNQDGTGANRGNQPIYYSFADWEPNIPILKKLVFDNKNRFKQIVYDVLVQGFNPNILNPHINEIKSFLSPYVREDFTAKNGSLPGRINKAGSRTSSSYSNFEYNIENSVKNWISKKFDVACSNYGFSKTEILNQSSKFTPKPYDYTGTGSKPATTTTTEKPKTTTTSATAASSPKPSSAGKRYDIIKEGESKISAGWDNLSWGVESFRYDGEGNMINNVNADSWGAVSFKRNDSTKLGYGILYFKAKANVAGATLQVLVHTTNGERFTFGNVGISTSKMTEYNVVIDIDTNVKFDRISIQDATNSGLILTLNDIYYMDGATATTTKPITTTTTTTTTTIIKTTTSTPNTSMPTSTGGTRYDIIKAGDKKITTGWEDWSWGIKSYRFDSQGNMICNINANEWGAASFRRPGVRLGNGVLYFKAMANVSGATLNIYIHTVNDDYVYINKVENISNTKMTEYSVEFKLENNVKFNRISIQDSTNVGFTLTLNDVYYMDGATAVYKTTTTIKPTTTTTTTSVKPTTTTTTTTSVKPTTTTTTTTSVKPTTTTTTTTSVKPTTTTTTSVKPTTTTTTIITSVKPTTTTTTTTSVKPTTTTTTTITTSVKPTTTTTTTTTVKVTTTTTIKKTTTTVGPVPTSSGTRYDIIKSGDKKLSAGWEDWSWGLSSYRFDSKSNMVCYINEDEWGAASFKRPNVRLGNGILYFKARANVAGNSINIYVHAIDEDYIHIKTIENLSTEMTEYSVAIELKNNVKFNRISIQDANNTGFTLYLNDVYYMDGATTTTPKTTTTTTTTSKRTTTITTTKKITTTTTSVLVPTPAEGCKEVTKGYYPCGGLNYPDASPCCEEGFKCEYVNEFYSRCALILY